MVRRANARRRRRSAPGPATLDLEGVEIANRFVRAVGPTTTAEDGTPSPTQLTAFAAAATDDPGLLLTEPLAVSASGRPTTGSPGIYADEHGNEWADAVADIPDGITVGTHLVHAGSTAGREAPLFDFKAASAREDTWAPRRSESFPTPPRAFDTGAMDDDLRGMVREQFVDAARRADDAGFNYLQVHAGSNTLLGQTLLAPRGSIECRVTFPASVVQAIRSAWPDDKPLGVTLPVSDRDPDGLSLDDAFDAVAALADVGSDLVAPVDVASDDQEPAEWGPSDYSDAIRNELEVPTMATVPTTSVDKVDTLVAIGRADLCTFPTPRSRGD